MKYLETEEQKILGSLIWAQRDWEIKGRSCQKSKGEVRFWQWENETNLNQSWYQFQAELVYFR